MSEFLWNKNLCTLNDRDPYLTEIMKHYDELMEEPDDEASDEPVITAGVTEAEGRKVLYALRGEELYQLDTAYDSERFAALWYDSLPKMNLMAKVFLYGLGNGMYVRELLAKADESVIIVVYEPSLIILKTVLEEFDMTDILENHRVVLLVREALTKATSDYFNELIDFRDIDGMIYNSYLNYNRVFPKEYDEYFEALNYTVNAVATTQHVISRFGERYTYNTLENMKHLLRSKSLTALYERMPKDIPAIIVAAGPSLDKNVEELRAAQGKCFMICVDSAVRVLLKHDIIPDIIVTVDGKKNVAHFSDPRCNEIPMFAVLLSNSDVLQNHHAPILFGNDLNRHVQSFLSQHEKLLPTLGTGGSVANDAFSLADTLDLKTIILVGQDLAYTGNKTHSAETVRGEMQMDAQSLSNGEYVEGYYGDQVLSSNEFDLYRKWFEVQCETLKDVRVINATEGGARIRGTVQLPLREAIAQECNHEAAIGPILEALPDFLTDLEKAEFKEYLRRMPAELEEYLGLTKKMKRNYEKMLELVYHDRLYSGQMEKLLGSNNQMTEVLEMAPTMEYIQNNMQQYTTDTLVDVYRMEDNDRDEVIASAKRGTEYTTAMIREIERFLPMVKEWLDREEI